MDTGQIEVDFLDLSPFVSISLCTWLNLAFADEIDLNKDQGTEEVSFNTFFARVTFLTSSQANPSPSKAWAAFNKYLMVHN